MLIHVPQRRSPAAARSWLLLIFLLPWPGAVLYWLIGRPYVARRRIELQKRVSKLIRAAVSAQGAGEVILPAPWTGIAKLGENLGDFALRPGNSVELLPDYDASIDRLIADIDAATHHVHLLYYIWGNDRTGQRVADAVVRAAGRGVQCRMLLDAAGSKRALRALAIPLRKAGVEVVPLLPAGLVRRNAARFDLRNHRKIAVIDGRIGYTGSQNIINADFKSPLVYEELVVRITGPVVRQLQIVLLADYFAETLKEVVIEEFLPEVEPVGESNALVVSSGPSYPHLNNLDLVISLVHAAQRRIVITSPYFVPNDALIEAMLTAVMRGVEVHLVACKQIDQWLVGLAQRSYYEQLLEGGVRVHAYRPRFLHAKHLTFDDDVALVGSSNMDIRSFQLNEEISLLIHDRSVVEEMKKIQERYFAASEEITLEAWRARPEAIRMAQNIARLADALL
jgi:cardiolipin synthase